MSKHLPVINSTAAETEFVFERIDGRSAPYRHLFVDGNSKITAGNGTYAKPKPNAFSLVQVADCPGSTPTCRASCYVHDLEASRKEVHDLYRHNSATIREILDDADDRQWWANRMAGWIGANAAAGFRWHVSGDLFSPEYAAWVTDIAQLSLDVRHWIYTRSFYMSAAFVGVPNVTVNYSVDRDNYEAGKMFAAAHAGIGEPVRLCYLVTDDGYVPSDLPEGSVIFPDYALRAPRSEDATPSAQRAGSTWWQSLTSAQKRMVCPVDFYGKSEGVRCGPCRKCIDPVPR